MDRYSFRCKRLSLSVTHRFAPAHRRVEKEKNSTELQRWLPHRRFHGGQRAESSRHRTCTRPPAVTVMEHVPEGSLGFHLCHGLHDGGSLDTERTRDPVGSKYSADHELQWLPSVRSPGANDSPSNRALDLVQPALQDRTRRSGGEYRGRFPRLSQPDVVDLQLKCRNPSRRNCSAESDFEFG